jgi:hypothetical protein
VTEDLVEALWVGSHPAELPDRRTLRSGKDTALVGRTEAETSDNWLYPIPNPKADAPKAEAPKPAAKPAAAPAKAGD